MAKAYLRAIRSDEPNPTIVMYYFVWRAPYIVFNCNKKGQLGSVLIHPVFFLLTHVLLLSTQTYQTGCWLAARHGEK